MVIHTKTACAALAASFVLASAAAYAAGARADRIVSLKPNITDIVYALGLGDRLAGVTRYCDVPSGAPRPQIVADYTQPYIERIVALSPDIVLASKENSSRRSIETIERMGIRVELFAFTTLAETMDSIRAIGRAMGAAEGGAELAGRMEKGFDALKARWGLEPQSRVAVIWGIRPMVVAGPGSYMDELLGTIAATNVVRATKIKYPRIGLEELIALDPDAIIDLSMGSERPGLGTRDTGPGKTGRPWEDIAAIRAVRERRIIALDAKDFRAGPRLPEALDKLAKLIHGFGTRDRGPGTRK